MTETVELAMRVAAYRKANPQASWATTWCRVRNNYSSPSSLQAAVMKTGLVRSSGRPGRGRHGTFRPGEWAGGRSECGSEA